MKTKILASFTILIIGLIFTQVGIIPKYSQYKRLHNQWEKAQQTLAARQRYYAQLFTMKEKLNNAQAAVSKASAALPSDPDAPALYKFIQEKASENGLVLKNLGELKTIQSDNSSINIIEFKELAEGNYGSLLSFLKSVEGSSRLINVTSVRLLPEENEEGNKKPKTVPVPRYSLTLEADYSPGI